MTNIRRTSHRTKIGFDATASNSELGLNLPSICRTTRRGSYKETIEFDASEHVTADSLLLVSGNP